MSAARVVRGRIACLDRERRVWGRERFDISIDAQRRVLRTVTEFHDRGVQRDANWTLSPQGLPLEGFIRDIVRDRTEMFGWFRVAGREVSCEAWVAATGRLSRSIEAPGPIEHLGLHSIVADCLVGAHRGPTAPGVERAVRCVTQSTADYGLGGYGIHLVPPLVTYVGREPVSVEAGRFAAEHFRVRWSDQVPKYSDFWVREDFVPLRLLGASGDVSYELFEIEDAS
ncbi:MAG: hypothetical protein U1F11_05290 [Steroidobacteraceae bacterium]